MNLILILQADNLGLDKKWSGRSKPPPVESVVGGLISPPPLWREPSENILIWQCCQTPLILFFTSIDLLSSIFSS